MKKENVIKLFDRKGYKVSQNKYGEYFAFKDDKAFAAKTLNALGKKVFGKI